MKSGPLSLKQNLSRQAAGSEAVNNSLDNRNGAADTMQLEMTEAGTDKMGTLVAEWVRNQ